ncbi:AGAP002162-PA-like protein [Anopheles sinensis]|uniref:AGAP002162-PA-like protein n=1 Tax=Anopheles sinensis TaxID=74873 RepID=A0A084WSB2_ANOSI|nr:AGAP002162-PA-like protein [Anopheles sinensis]
MLYSRTAATYHADFKCNKHSTEAGNFLIPCAICKQKFGTRNELETHLKAEHTTEEEKILIHEINNKLLNHECDVCGRKFSQSITLRRHKLRHEGIKPYQCNHCKRCFTQKGTLKTHLRTHTNEKPYLCPVCGDSFRSAGTLRNHRIRRCGGGEI